MQMGKCGQSGISSHWNSDNSAIVHDLANCIQHNFLCFEGIFFKFLPVSTMMIAQKKILRSVMFPLEVWCFAMPFANMSKLPSRPQQAHQVGISMHISELTKTEPKSNQTKPSLHFLGQINTEPKPNPSNHELKEQISRQATWAEPIARLTKRK